jgi:hypothetical protein
MDKATRYQRRRQATITTMADDGTSIEGRVQGSAPMAYRASIALVPAADGSVAIRGSCTCPVGSNCKHVAALLIESMARPGPTRAAAAPAQTPAAPPPVTLPNEAAAWLADLDREMALSEDAYQLAGYSWLRFLAGAGLGGVLADDMGLGKTVQALALVLAERVERGADRASLVVAPTSLMANWRLEAHRFAPALKVLTLHGPERKAQFESIDGHDLVLTTFALLPRDREVLVAQPWRALIVDEAQNVKNPQTNAAKVLRQLQAKQRICLTGTPIENHLGELWALMDFLNPGLLGDRRQFARSFRGPIEKAGNADRREALVRRIRPFLLRRTKAQVAAELPAKTEIIERVEMDPGQNAIYEAGPARHAREGARGDRRQGARAQPDHHPRRAVEVAAGLLRPTAGEAPIGEEGCGRLGQAAPADGDARGACRRGPAGAAVLPVHQHAGADRGAAGGGEHRLRQDHRAGARPGRRRRTLQAGEVPLFLISLKAGGTGLNLTAADTVILYDPWWNPAVEAQAIDRSHRIGQDKPVFVHRLVTLGTIGEKMLELQRRKGALAAGLLDPEAGGALDITADDIERLLAEG